MSGVLSIIVRVLGTEAAKTLIAMLFNKLLKSADDGVTKDVAVIAIDAIAKSKANPTTEDVFRDAMGMLG